MIPSFCFLSTLLLTILATPAVAQFTNGSCINDACAYVAAHLAECSQGPSAMSNTDAYTQCLCTQRYTVNLDRCIRGEVCAWDGVSDLNNQQPCITLYCPGSFEEPNPMAICGGSGFPLPGSGPGGSSASPNPSGSASGTIPAPSATSATIPPSAPTLITASTTSTPFQGSSPSPGAPSASAAPGTNSGVGLHGLALPQALAGIFTVYGLYVFSLAL